MNSTSPESENHLARSRSPYLLQHAKNPVDWYEWGAEAFKRAKDRDVPIFLSIGYSTCHWCHVMAHESFDSDAIASEMNRLFVNIKVDREERPDVDRIYMAFVQSLTGSGGWPMSVWLTPDLKPFYGGTYFPPQNRHGRIGFPELIGKIGALWSERRQELVEQGSKYLDTIKENLVLKRLETETLNIDAPNQCLEELVQQFDERWGGFGSAPKFPMPSNLSFLLEMVDLEGLDERKRKLIGFTLDRMADGGIRDHVAGGFHRYSVDRTWHVPHFEKMLYDQGQLAGIYADSSRLLGRIEYLATAMEIVSYVEEQLSMPDGGIFSAEDADSPLPGEADKSGEGVFYMWTLDELRNVLDEDSFTVFSLVFGVRQEGNAKPESDPHGEFKGLNTLMRAKSVESVANDLLLDAEEVSRLVHKSLSKLKTVRCARPRPHLDDKILASWNAYMVSGACKVFQSSGDKTALNLAIASGQFIASQLFDGSTNILYRAFRIERGNTPAFAEDYASSAMAFLDLYECTGSDNWLAVAERFIEILIEAFWDDEGYGFFATRFGDESLIARLKDDYDGAEPSANSLAAIALLKLGAILGDERYDRYARKTIGAFRYQWANTPRAMPLMLVALMRVVRPAQQVVMTGNPESKEFQSMQQLVFARRRLHSAIFYLNEDSGWLRDRNQRLSEFDYSSEDPSVYLCENYACKLPAIDLEMLGRQFSGD